MTDAKTTPPKDGLAEEPLVDISDAELQEIYLFALDLGRRAGRILLDGVEKRTRIGKRTGEEEVQVEKMNAVDIVTQTDLDAEAFIKEEINRKYPTHEFIGEETYSSGASKDYLITSAPTWCVDPLDGTVNYTHLFPMFCTSIAFIHNSTPVIGVIHAPLLRTTFSSLRGHGAWQDHHSPYPEIQPPRRLPYVNSPANVLPPNAPKGCTFSCEWGKDRRDIAGGNLERKVESFVNMATEIGGRSGKGGMVHGVRSLGSATLDLAYIACGALDIWWEGGCWEWDVAAGIAILREAGGLITSANPPPNPQTDPIGEVKLGSRLYLAIRPAGDNPVTGESGRESQERVVREVWKRVRELDYVRPGA